LEKKGDSFCIDLVDSNIVPMTTMQRDTIIAGGPFKIVWNGDTKKMDERTEEYVDNEEKRTRENDALTAVKKKERNGNIFFFFFLERRTLEERSWNRKAFCD
jgi:hypothetical protein